MAADLYCPKDYNLGDTRETQCNVGGLPCPTPLPVDPDTVVQVSCGPCGREWGIPIGDVMKGRTKGKHSCQLQVCAAKIIPADPVTITKEVPPSGLLEGSVLLDDGTRVGIAAQFLDTGDFQVMRATVDAPPTETTTRTQPVPALNQGESAESAPKAKPAKK